MFHRAADELSVAHAVSRTDSMWRVGRPHLGRPERLFRKQSRREWSPRPAAPLDATRSACSTRSQRARSAWSADPAPRRPHHRSLTKAAIARMTGLAADHLDHHQPARGRWPAAAWQPAARQGRPAAGALFAQPRGRAELRAEDRPAQRRPLSDQLHRQDPRCCTRPIPTPRRTHPRVRPRPASTPCSTGSTRNGPSASRASASAPPTRCGPGTRRSAPPRPRSTPGARSTCAP